MRIQLPGSTPSAHAGLLLDRYLVDDLVRLERKDTPDVEEWRRLMNIAPSIAYKLAFKRWKEMLPATVPDGVNASMRIAKEGRVTGRFITGLGAEGVFEVNIRLHHTYGVSFVPGTALKGALRSFMENVLGQAEAASFLFGTTENAGFAKVYDAWYVPGSGRTSSGLDLDVISIHHQDYYSRKGSPTDFDQPVPVHFLTAQGKFLFVLEAPSREWGTYLEKLLASALECAGVGAKKTSGYGRFEF